MSVTGDGVPGVRADTRDGLLDVACVTIGNGDVEEVISDHFDTVLSIRLDSGLGVEFVFAGALDPWCEFSRLESAVDKNSRCRRSTSGSLDVCRACGKGG